MDSTAAIRLRPRQRVTDSEGNRGWYLRDVPMTVAFNWENPGAIIRYVGDDHESVCPLSDLTAGWAKNGE